MLNKHTSEPYDVGYLMELAKHYGGLTECTIHGAINKVKSITAERNQLKKSSAELLEALEAVLHIPALSPVGQTWDKARVAIAKAKERP